MASQGSASLTTLPLEIRLQILNYLVPSNQRYQIRRNDHAHNIGQVRRLTGRNPWNRTVWSCLLTNHFLSKEVLELLYGRNTLIFSDPWLIETFMVRIGQANLHRIKHVEVSSGPLIKVHNTSTATTLFSIISSNFTGLETLQIIGVGRGKTVVKTFDPTLWLPSHLERLEFITSLPGVLQHAKVYCDKDESNTRLICEGVDYRKEHDEIEVDMDGARIDMKISGKIARKNKLNGSSSILDVDMNKQTAEVEVKPRKRAKLATTYRWKS